MVNQENILRCEIDRLEAEIISLRWEVDQLKVKINELTGQRENQELVSNRQLQTKANSGKSMYRS